MVGAPIIIAPSIFPKKKRTQYCICQKPPAKAAKLHSPPSVVTGIIKNALFVLYVLYKDTRACMDRFLIEGANKLNMLAS